MCEASITQVTAGAKMELQAEELLARQAVQLLTEASREDEATDHDVLATLAVLENWLDGGTLS